MQSSTPLANGWGLVGSEIAVSNVTLCKLKYKRNYLVMSVMGDGWWTTRAKAMTWCDYTRPQERLLA